MILSTSWDSRPFTAADTAGSTSDTTAFLGLEMLASMGVTAPTTPIRSPPVSTTVEAAIRPRSTSACRSGSSVKSTLAERKGMAGENPVMNRAVTSGPRSKSWLPRAMAS